MESEMSNPTLNEPEAQQNIQQTNEQNIHTDPNDIVFENEDIKLYIERGKLTNKQKRAKKFICYNVLLEV